MTTLLCELAEKYFVDKCPKYRHYYTPEYHNLLKDKNYDLCLEIGVGYPELMKKYTSPEYKAGASLKMWRDYFNCEVIGLDIKEFDLKEPNIRTIQCDQSDFMSLEESMCSVLPALPQLIVDDGSHLVEHQITSFKTLWKYCSDMYIIEDINEENIKKIEELSNGLPNCKVIQSYIHPGEYQGFVAFQKIELN